MEHRQRMNKVNEIRSILYGLQNFQNETVIEECRNIERLLDEIIHDEIVEHRGPQTNPYAKDLKRLQKENRIW